MLKSYFDGGNEPDTTQYSIVTLAAYSARAGYWPKFEKEWAKVLRKHRAPYVHATDIKSGAKPFTRNNGWSLDKKNKFRSDCVAVIGDSCNAGKMRGVTTSVILDDYKRAVVDIPDTPSVEALCSMLCLHDAMLWYGPTIWEDRVSLFFDRNERYRGYVSDRWNRKKFKKEGLHAIASITESNMIETPGLQAADLLAWSVNAAYDGDCSDWQGDLLDIPRDKHWFDDVVLRRPNKDVLRTIAGWKMPRRKPIR